LLETIKFWRDNREARSNVAQSVVKHSPDGFEWGYSGSGPADLAYNILYALTTERIANELYQTFKREVISGIPYWGCELEVSKVLLWVGSKIEELNSNDLMREYSKVIEAYKSNGLTEELVREVKLYKIPRKQTVEIH